MGYLLLFKTGNKICAILRLGRNRKGEDEE